MKKFIATYWRALLVVSIFGVGMYVLFFLPCPNRCAPGEELLTIADTDIVPCRDVCGFPALTIIAFLSLPFVLLGNIIPR